MEVESPRPQLRPFKPKKPCEYCNKEISICNMTTHLKVCNVKNKDLKERIKNEKKEKKMLKEVKEKEVRDASRNAELLKQNEKLNKLVEHLKMELEKSKRSEDVERAKALFLEQKYDKLINKVLIIGRDTNGFESFEQNIHNP